MAARLTVDFRGVWLGSLRLASFLKCSKGHILNYMLVDGSHQKSRRYEDPEDCKWDAESEVRRLLKEAGVDCE
jgi:hypothetical protein